MLQLFDVMRQGEGPFFFDGTIFHPLETHEAGHVQLIDMMPRLVPEGLTCDYAIPEMARTSYGGGTKRVNDDSNLIRYLLRKDHVSPFEGIVFKFRIRCPIFVYRQWFRHRTTDQCEIEIVSTDETARKFTSMNEQSARYSIMPDIWYIPLQLRKQSTNNKQGSEGFLNAEDREVAWGFIDDTTRMSREVYEKLLGYGVAREIARAVLPVCYVTEFYMVTNLLNLFRWLILRVAADAQEEIRVYANIILSILAELCPVATSAFVDFQLMAKSFSRHEMALLLDMIAKAGSANKEEVERFAAAAKEMLSTREKNEFNAKTSIITENLDYRISQLTTFKYSRVI